MNKINRFIIPSFVLKNSDFLSLDSFFFFHQIYE